jgi:hypothetical protein
LAAASPSAASDLRFRFSFFFFDWLCSLSCLSFFLCFELVEASFCSFERFFLRCASAAAAAS